MRYKNVIIAGDLNCDFTQTTTGAIESTLGNKLSNLLPQISSHLVIKEVTDRQH